MGDCFFGEFLLGVDFFDFFCAEEVLFLGSKSSMLENLRVVRFMGLCTCGSMPATELEQFVIEKFGIDLISGGKKNVKRVPMQT